MRPFVHLRAALVVLASMLACTTSCIPSAVAMPAASRLASAGLASAGLASADTGFDTRDAARFAAVFLENGGAPDAPHLQRQYVEGSGPGLLLMFRQQGADAAALARAIQADPMRYRHAVGTCLPWFADMQPVHAAVAGGWQRVWPGLRVPPLYVMVGTAGSAGIGVPGEAVVLDLAAICEGIHDASALEARLGALAAHELAHVLQPPWPDDAPSRHDLLQWALREGGANLLGALALGEDPEGVPPPWVRGREAALLREFMDDRALMLERWRPGTEPDSLVVAAGTRWFWNGVGAEGRPADLGYWMGQRIAYAWYQGQPDKLAARKALLALADADGILAGSALLPAD